MIPKNIFNKMGGANVNPVLRLEIGHKYRILSWEELAERYGFIDGAEDDININVGFPIQMSRLCNQFFTPVFIYENNRYNGINYVIINGWKVTNQMCVEVLP